MVPRLTRLIDRHGSPADGPEYLGAVRGHAAGNVDELPSAAALPLGGSNPEPALSAVAGTIRNHQAIETLGRVTDRAVLEGAASANVAVDHEIRAWRRVAALPFEPARGYHAALGRNRTSALLCVKGAPEIVLPRPVLM